MFRRAVQRQISSNCINKTDGGRRPPCPRQGLLRSQAFKRKEKENIFCLLAKNRLQTLEKLKIPAGLSHFFTGAKIAAVSVVAKGFGDLTRAAAAQLDTPRVFSLILFLSLMGAALFGLVAYVERRVVFRSSCNRSVR